MFHLKRGGTTLGKVCARIFVEISLEVLTRVRFCGSGLTVKVIRPAFLRLCAVNQADNIQAFAALTSRGGGHCVRPW